MRIGKHFIVYVERTPLEYRLGIELKPCWVNGFGRRQVVLTFYVGSCAFQAIWEC